MKAVVSVRQLDRQDRESYFRLRLSGLESHPEAFATSAGEWRNASPEKIDALLLLSEENREPILGAFHSSAEMVGSVCLIPETREAVRHKASLAALYVEQNWQQKGIGMRLVAETLRLARERAELMLVRLVVDSENRIALQLFEKAGFFIYGREPQARRVGDRYYDQSYMLCFLRDLEHRQVQD
jgi:ribosomal protein S18 acetylase RimI-like enzyme